MNKDVHLMFEAYATKNSEKNNTAFNQKQMEDRKTSSTDPMERIEQKRKNKKNIGSIRSEDAESTNIDVDTLIDTIKEDQIKKGNREYAYSYVVGVLSSIIKEALQNPKSLQSSINRSYQSFTEKK
jgi:hypothetical protein